MKRGTSHIAPLAFLVLLLLPLVGSFVLQLVQWHLKQTAEERTEKHAIISLTLAPEKIIWEKPGKELLVDGRLFDVKKHRLQDGFLFVTGFFDDAETTIASLLSQQNEENRKTTTFRLLMALQCFAGVIAFVHVLYFCQKEKRLFPRWLPFLPHPCFFALEQPPKC